jgi:hypothetical protein
MKVKLTVAKSLRIGSPAELIDQKGLFCDMVRNTGEYNELVALVKESS